jgi:hypothetical protein
LTAESARLNLAPSPGARRLTLRLGPGRFVDDLDPSVLWGEQVGFVLRPLLSVADGMEICGG